MANEVVSFIIPVHKITDTLERAVNSIIALENAGVDKHIIVVRPSDVTPPHDMPALESVEWCITNKENNSYPDLVNFGIDQVISTNRDRNDGKQCNWIYILESDDEILPKALKIFKQFKDYKTADIYAPISLIVEDSENSSTKKLLALQNEASWAQGIAEEMGFIDFNMMLRTNFLFVNNCFISLKTIEDYGKFKPELQYVFDYEFALRMVYNGAIIFAIPRATHYHYNSSEGYSSMFRNLPQDERDFWVSLARKEYFYEDSNPRYRNRESFSYKAK